MTDHRIYIIGASGTGKTTLAKAIAHRLQSMHFDSDDYFHYPTDPPFLKQRSPEERALLLSKDLQTHSSWVLSGGAGTWKPAVKLDFTFVIFLYLPPEIRLDRLRKREKELYGNRLLKGGDMETIHQEFMEWTQGYDDGSAEGTNTLVAHQDFVEKVTCPLLKLEQPLTTEEQLNLVFKSLLPRGSSDN